MYLYLMIAYKRVESVCYLAYKSEDIGIIFINLLKLFIT